MCDRGRVAVTAHTIPDAGQLKQAGTGDAAGADSEARAWQQVGLTGNRRFDESAFPIVLDLIVRTADRTLPLESATRDPVIVRLRTGSVRAVLFAVMWWILTDGAVDSWLVGVPLVLFATLVSGILVPPFSWSVIRIARFVPFFLWHSLSGGVDVARRALHPRLPISPRLFDHRWRLPPGPQRVFMANTVSLLPGTLSAELDEEYLRVHVLDHTGAFAAELARIEVRVARLFGLNLVADGNEE
jgi:multicomponent Na+:H+ antiporter subunit E